MDNVYKRGFPTGCFNCLCYYCHSHNCPNGWGAYSRKYNFCTQSRDRGACPRVSCDYFVHARLVLKRYIVVNRRRAEAPAMRLLQDIDKRLKRLEEKYK